MTLDHIVSLQQLIDDRNTSLPYVFPYLICECFSIFDLRMLLLLHIKDCLCQGVNHIYINHCRSHIYITLNSFMTETVII